MSEIPKFFQLPYRCLQRVMVFEGVKVLVAQSCDAISSTDSSNNVRRLSARRIQSFVERGEAPYCEQLISYLSSERVVCFGYEEDNHLLSFVWVHLGSPPAELNQGRHPAMLDAVDADAGVAEMTIDEVRFH